MAVNDFTGQNIQDTYQRVVQTDGTSLADGTGSLLPISFDGNNVIISGSLTATEYSVTSSVTNVVFQQQSGSTIFGDSQDDTHLFTGSLNITGNLNVSEHIISDKYKINIHPTSLTADVIRLEGNHITYGPSLDNGEIYNTTISGSNIRLYADGDIITNIGGDDFIISKSDTEFFRFNLETNPVIETIGNLTIDPTGGNTNFDSHITASGNISASGILIGGGLNLNDGDIINANNITANNIAGTITTAAQTNITRIGTLAQDLTVNGHITASGDISASGNIIANNASISGVISSSHSGGSNNVFGAGVDIHQELNMKSTNELKLQGGVESGTNPFTSSLITNFGPRMTVILDASGISDDEVFEIRKNNPFYTLATPIFSIDSEGSINQSANITASGNISASGDLIVNNVIGNIDGGTF